MEWYAEIISLGEQWYSGEITAEHYWKSVKKVMMARDPNQYVIGPVAIGSCSEVIYD